MSALGKALIALGLACFLAAVWLPDSWWQLVITALVIFVTGAAILGSRGGPE